MENKAAFALSVSNIVSTNKISTPPSIKASICCLYATAISSKLTARYPGLFTSGEIEQVRFVGPMAPATKRGFSGVLFSVAASLAIFAEQKLMS